MTLQEKVEEGEGDEQLWPGQGQKCGSKEGKKE
eukprot:CAMPEP_0206491314 /NCGR_PEP_ID=MMETSP0324_2-20121206/44888_1 /ASSEMBLY_ACC=CAM_ASM_000836 /TAXON_ID=2866 /ORGANISM="Crypthecodinium cohnii, Strain Seligo" /LENGTH=32 /DNA_ID= /DNA_START= /DNA_END= /DNA_ORIENTATION=